MAQLLRSTGAIVPISRCESQLGVLSTTALQTCHDPQALFRKIETYAPHVATGMEAMYEKSLKLVDIWSAPPIPVVCVIGSGKPTVVHFGYCESWPNVFNEEPCALKYEDGDTTVPRRSAESVCREWQRQCEIHFEHACTRHDPLAWLVRSTRLDPLAWLVRRRKCYTTISSVQKARYRGHDAQCVDVVLMHCRSPNMESVGLPRGSNHCEELHQRILNKVPTIDLVQELATNVHAYEPSYSATLEQLHEHTKDVAWLYNSAARDLPHVAKLSQTIDASFGVSPKVSVPWAADEEMSALVQQLQQAWAILKQRERYQRVLSSLDAIRSARARSEEAVGSVSKSVADEMSQQQARGEMMSELEARLNEAEENLKPLLCATNAAFEVFRTFQESCNGTQSRSGFDSLRDWTTRRCAKAQRSFEGHEFERSSDGACDADLDWSTADLMRSGLPDCSAFFEAASHRYLRQVGC